LAHAENLQQMLTTRLSERDIALHHLTQQVAHAENTQQILTARLSERDKGLHDLTEQVALKETAIQEQHDENQGLMGSLVAAQAQLADLQNGLAFAVLTRYRSFVDRVLPIPSRGRQLYITLLAVPRILLTEGPRGLMRRVRHAARMGSGSGRPRR
jgi:hypothetical protein